jgi:hypothetical protein
MASTRVQLAIKRERGSGGSELQKGRICSSADRDACSGAVALSIHDPEDLLFGRSGGIAAPSIRSSPFNPVIRVPSFRTALKPSSDAIESRSPRFASSAVRETLQPATTPRNPDQIPNPETPRPLGRYRDDDKPN